MDGRRGRRVVVQQQSGGAGRWLPAIVGSWLCAAAAAQVPGPHVASLTHAGQFSDSNASTPAISADGRVVAFVSNGSDLVPDDDNFAADVFVRDRQTGDLICASRALDGSTGDGSSFSPAISADGRFVAFHSEAHDLVADDTNGFDDVFVFDLVTGVTELVSVDSTGRQAELPCHQPALSGDGRLVAFETYSANLVPGSHPGVRDIYLHDRADGSTILVTRGMDGGWANGSSGNATFSRDGSRLAFESWSDNLAPGDQHNGVDVYVYDVSEARARLVSKPPEGGAPGGSSYNPVLSVDGRFVAFSGGGKHLVPGDTNGFGDCYLADLLAGTIELISVGSDGQQGNSHSGQASFTAGGRYMVFQSSASNLAPGDVNVQQDLFVRDRRDGTTVMLSVNGLGVQGDQLSNLPVLAADSGDVAFESWAGNLVPGDLNEVADIFVHNVYELLGTR